jgi:hypothetical protein
MYPVARGHVKSPKAVFYCLPRPYSTFPTVDARGWGGLRGGMFLSRRFLVDSSVIPPHYCKHGFMMYCVACCNSMFFCWSIRAGFLPRPISETNLRHQYQASSNLKKTLKKCPHWHPRKINGVFHSWLLVSKLAPTWPSTWSQLGQAGGPSWRVNCGRPKQLILSKFCREFASWALRILIDLKQAQLQLWTNKVHQKKIDFFWPR